MSSISKTRSQSKKSSKEVFFNEFQFKSGIIICAWIALMIFWASAATASDLCSKFVKSDQWDSAIHACTEQIESGSDTGCSLVADYTNRWYANYEKGLYDLAVSDCTKAIELSPFYVPAYGVRGYTYREEKEYKPAIADFTKIIELRPRDPNNYNERGAIYDDDGEYDIAIADYTKAIELNPSDTDAYINRSIAYQHEGQVDPAITDLTKVIEINPANASIIKNEVIYMARKVSTVKPWPIIQKL
ncbi:MAG: tetratricopeptide repeat protein [Nitrospiraceae bacterium]|nr:tetratricopeptide repeat protein [Nitrospiraceae bacterium]